MSSTRTLRADVDATAHDGFGFDSLLPGQRDAIESVVSGRDTLLVLATGGGKSAVYQIAGAERGGITVVVSPLVALQADQVAGIEVAPSAPPAVAINSASSTRRIREAWERIDGGGPLYVLLAPEQLAKPENVERLAAAGVSLVVIDEAHCMSSWGHDFRPDYLRLGEVVTALGRPPVLAMTATASRPVREEIIEKLRMQDPRVLVHGVDRPEIHLAVTRHESDAEKRAAVVAEAATWTKPGLVYVATRRDAEEYAWDLQGDGRRVAAYHAGLRASERRAVHEAWRAGELDVVVATSAFGMGIDRADVRFVLHATATESIDAYYQEIGRAGRDGEPARAALHYRAEDLGLRHFFASRAVDRVGLRAVWEAIDATDGRTASIADAIGRPARTVSRLLNDLDAAGLLDLSGAGARRLSDLSARAAASAAADAIASRERVAESRLAMMRGYAESTHCRRRMLLDYFGVDSDEWCGNCDACDRRHSTGPDDGFENGAGTGPERDTTGPLAVDDEVEHAEWGTGTVMSTEDDRATVFFEVEGYKVLSLGALATGVLRRATV